MNTYHVDKLPTIPWIKVPFSPHACHIWFGAIDPDNRSDLSNLICAIYRMILYPNIVQQIVHEYAVAWIRRRGVCRSGNMAPRQLNLVTRREGGEWSASHLGSCASGENPLVSIE